MTAPTCSRYDDALGRIKGLLATEQPVGDLRRYLNSFGGAQFDRLIDSLAVDEFTLADFKTVGDPILRSGIGGGSCLRWGHSHQLIPNDL